MIERLLYKHCLTCDTIFFKSPSNSRKAWKEQCKYCSRQCQWESLKGGKSRLGTKNSEYFGANHRIWKGEKVSYAALHHWVKRNKGRIQKCENCGLNDPERTYHWANIDGAYKRDLDDFIRLCVPCHSRHDKDLILHISKTRFPEKVGV